MKCPCGGSTYVIDTRKAGNEIRRFRKCKVCERKLVTMETFVEALGKAPTIAQEPKPKPKPKPPKVPVATSNKRKVEVRRRLEDIKLRVPSYYIEDDDY